LVCGSSGEVRGGEVIKGEEKERKTYVELSFERFLPTVLLN
jgi:hypothetical protein